MTTPVESPSEASSLEKIATELCRLSHMDARKDLAALRRMRPCHLPPSAFYAVMARAGFTGLGEDAISDWARIVQMMAQRPNTLHSGDLGASLAAIGFSAQRLDVLLDVRGETLFALARRTASRLATSHQPFPYRDLADLIRFQDGLEADRVRIRVAQSYVRSRRTD